MAALIFALGEHCKASSNSLLNCQPHYVNRWNVHSSSQGHSAHKKVPACRSFLQAVLPQLRHLAPLLSSGNAGKELMLRLLSRLLSLSAQTVLSPMQPAFEFVLDSYVTLLSTR